MIIKIFTKKLKKTIFSIKKTLKFRKKSIKNAKNCSFFKKQN